MLKHIARPKWQFFDTASGAPLVGGKLYSYAAGTSALLATYSDAEGTATNTNPIILNARGEADVWLADAGYKFVLKDADDNLIWESDNHGGTESDIDTELLGWAFSSTTAMADPGSGIIRFNHATLASVTAIAIDDLTAAAQDFSAYVATWTSGTLTLRQRSGPFAVFNVASVADNAGWSQLTVTYIGGGGSFVASELVGTAFAKAGSGGGGSWTLGADAASAGALALGAGNIFDITGAVTITSIASKGVGSIVVLQFDGALTLTHHATDLILPGAANITTADGDIATLYEYATGDWRCISYTKKALAPGAATTATNAATVTGINTGFAPGGSFTSGAVYVAKVGRIVTLTFQSLGHANLSNPSSTAGILSAEYRPLIDTRTTYKTETNFIRDISVTNAGTIQMFYLDYAGSTTSTTSTGAGSISYVSAS